MVTMESAAPPPDREKALPLPGWLVKVYFIFPVILYIPDALFNYYVYSDGAFGSHAANPLLAAASIGLWGFLAVGVVGMAYLLSVLAPWHWGQGHHLQALFCGLGVLVATGITTWNSLAYRSQSFSAFPTDQWAYALWPQQLHTLQQQHFSLTMLLVAIAPPFWGLFWAVVQPTETGRSLRQLQESHAERLLRVQQEAEVKRLRAETSAKVREAQLRGMAATAAAARSQAKGLLTAKATGATADATDDTADELRAAGNMMLDVQTPAEPAATQQQDIQEHTSAFLPRPHLASVAQAEPAPIIAAFNDMTPMMGFQGSTTANASTSTPATKRARKSTQTRSEQPQASGAEQQAQIAKRAPISRGLPAHVQPPHAG